MKYNMKTKAFKYHKLYLLTKIKDIKQQQEMFGKVLKLRKLFNTSIAYFYQVPCLVEKKPVYL